MEPTPLQNIVKTAISDLCKARTKAACKEIWAETITKLKSCKNAQNQPLSIYTIRKAVYNIRKGIKESLNPSVKAHKRRLNWLLYDQVKDLSGTTTKQLGIVVVGKEMAERNEEDKRRSVMQKVSDRGRVKDYTGMIAECETLLNSFDWRDLTIGIAMLTGRRTIEVLKTGTLTPAKGRYMRFSGQAKTKRHETFTIPVLSSPAKIAKALKRLRSLKDFDGVDNEAVNQKTQSALRQKVKKHLSIYTDRHTTVHDLRKIYTRICVQTILPKNDRIKDEHGNTILNERLYVKAILGHENTAIGLHYESWTLS